MRSLLHTANVRRNVLFLFVFTILSLIGLIKLIAYNSEKRKTGEAELQQNYKVMQNIESVRSSIGETESFIQSYMLTGDQQWKNSLSSAHDRMLKTLNETTDLEADPMQQHKFFLVKQAIEQKIAFQQTVMNADSITPELTAAMQFNGVNRHLTQRILSPLNLINERQQLLLQRNTDKIKSAVTHAKFVTIFSAVFVYMLILAALWHLRNQVQPGPSARMDDESDDAREQAIQEIQSDFRGVFSIKDGKDERLRRQGSTGLVRALWSDAELKEKFGVIAAKMDRRDAAEMESALAVIEEPVAEVTIPEWKAAGLPEELTLHFNQGNDHMLGQAVNANYYQPGPVYNRQPGSYIPGGLSAFRVLPNSNTAGNEVTRFPSQESPGFDLVELIKEVLHPFHAEAEEKNIRLLHTIDPSIPNFLSGDARKLRNILHSILENSMRFTYKGYIQLTITGVNINGEQAEIAFSVADTGKGLDAEQMHDLLNGTGSKIPALYHAKKLAESQQSQLMIHSTEEDGTVCCFMGCYRI